MNNLAFVHESFGQIRTIEEEGNVLFCARDIALALGYAKPENAIAAHCKATLKRGTPTAGGIQQLSYINEGDVYRLIFSCRLPAADQFEHWLFDVVVPSIRKHGMYATPQTIEQILDNPDFGIKILQELKNEREQRQKLEAEAEKNKPLVEFAQSVTDSQDGILIREMAKLLKKAGFDVGGGRLTEKMKDLGMLCRTGRGNEPTQKSLNMGWLIPKESTWWHPYTGQRRINITPLVTGKGQRYLFNLFSKHALL